MLSLSRTQRGRSWVSVLKVPKVAEPTSIFPMGDQVGWRGAKIW